jgi:spore germination protein GerM
MPRYIKYGLVVFLIILAAGVAYYFNLQQRIRQLVMPSQDAIQPYLAEQPVFLPGTPTKRIKLFFPSTARDGLLEPEDRDINVSSQIGDEAKQIIAELIRGSKEGRGVVLPMETKLRGVFICADGLALVDLTKEASTNHPGGLTQEVSSIYAIVNSLTENIAAVDKVQILIEGVEAETLAGHIDISQPFSQDLSMTPLPAKNK